MAGIFFAGAFFAGAFFAAALAGAFVADTFFTGALFPVGSYSGLSATCSSSFASTRVRALMPAMGPL